jgi:twitching motility protein PilU
MNSAMKVDGKVTKVSAAIECHAHADGARHHERQEASSSSAPKNAFRYFPPPGLGRFRVNAFVQQGQVGMVMRVIPATPAHLGRVACRRS